MEEKLQIVRELKSKTKEDEPKSNHFKYLIQAVYFTIDLTELIDLYVQNENLDLRPTLRNHLSRRIRDKSVNSKRICNKLMQAIKNVSYRKHQRIRFLLSKIIGGLPKAYAQKYSNFLMSTGYTSDLSALLKIPNLVWNSKFDQAFVSRYLETGNDKYLDAVLQNGQPESILNNIEDIWEGGYAGNYIKNKVIRMTAPHYIQELGFLKEKEPDKYLYALSFSNSNIKDEEIVDLYNRLAANQRSFGIWCIGKIGRWHIVKRYIEQYIH